MEDRKAMETSFMKHMLSTDTDKESGWKNAEQKGARMKYLALVSVVVLTLSLGM